jgi:hypothetical protein
MSQQRLIIDQEAFAGAFGVTSTAVRHTVADHPLFDLERIAELADYLPSHRVEHSSGKVDLVNPDGKSVQLDATPGDIARNIETNGAWLLIRNPEMHPEWARLIDECLDEIAPFVIAREGDMFRREGFLIVSAPNSNTPAHTDPEHNILIHIKGRKAMSTGDYPDAELRQRDLERTYSGGHRNMPVMPVNVTTYDMQPGDGCYVPPDMPHFVQTFDEVCISLSMTWRTPVQEVGRLAHTFNARARRLGLSPAAPGRSPGRDRAKAVAVRGMNKVGRVTGRAGA